MATKPTPEVLHNKFKIENITVTRAPLLKIYYWESFDVEGLNSKLTSPNNLIEHSMRYPPSQINSKPTKVIFWLRSYSNSVIEMRLKRIKNCDCKPQETRVGFNQFRQLYHCPHRRLIHILKEFIQINPDELVALSIVAYFFLFGEHTLTFEISLSDSRIVVLNLNLEIIGFDPLKCVMTKELVPVELKEYRRFVQPIWVRNLTMQNLNFLYSSRERGFKVINPNLVVPRQSIWPLMVEYRASDYHNKIELNMSYECLRGSLTITAEGMLELAVKELRAPKTDNECIDYPYVLYPNRLEFNPQTGEERSLMITIHNHNSKCVEFRWQNYIINDLFEITYEPNIFRLKAHHTKLCVIHVRVFDRPLVFKRIPAVLEVHRIFDKATKLAKSLLEEVESIDDPKWKEDSYMEHVFLHLDLKVNFKKLSIIDVHMDPPPPKNQLFPLQRVKTTVFEKLFWENLCLSSFMRESTEISDKLSYDEVLKMQPPASEKFITVNKNGILKMISRLIADGTREMAKSWRFVPVCYSELP